MKLTFIGTGSAFTVGTNNYHSNVLLEAPSGESLLIDCGSDARHALYEQGYSHQNVQDVYISHLHADHVGGLEWLAFNRYFDADCALINLHIHEQLIDTLWEHVLSGGMSSLKGEHATIDTFFNCMPIKSELGFQWQDVDFKTVSMTHVYDNDALVPCFGLFFSVNGKKILYTADTQFTPQKLSDYFEQADIIFHECETSKVKTGVHANYQDLKTLDDQIKSKMYLYHYNPGDLPDAKSDGFQGFVKKGQVFQF